MKKILAAIGKYLARLFSDLYSSAEKTFKALPEDQQLAMIYGSGFVDIVNKMLGEAPENVYSAMRVKFPKIDPAKLDEVIFMVAAQNGITEDKNSIEAIAGLQAKFSNAVDNGKKIWGYVSHGAAVFAALAFGSKNIQVSTISWLIQYVYEEFIEKK